MSTHDSDQAWKEVDRLISEQKFQAALDTTLANLEAARQRGDDDDTARALIKATQLRTGLHGYETAVRFLREQPWPESPRERMILELFYGRSLVTYLRNNSWEIGQRERVDTGTEVDLRAWTGEQIGAEAQAAYARAWHGRDAWGDASLGDLAEYVEQNNYPARIRGTLRDAVSYLWTELLSDSLLWSPRQSNELWRLDAAQLADTGRDPLAEAHGLDLDDPATFADTSIHPLAKLALVLADLEAWHLEHSDPEAAFEARRQRIEHLGRHFHEQADARALTEVLERRLDALGKRLPWWSMGQASLAERVRDLGDLPRAHALAEEGERAYPKSLGAQRCAHLAAAIAQPRASIRTMTLDGPGRRSIEVEHKNVEALNFRAYAIDFDRWLSQSKDYNILPGRREVEEILGRRQPDHAWRVELPATPDFASHNTFVTPPFETPGLYLVVASVRGDFAAGGNQRSAINFFLGDLVMLGRRLDEGYEVTVRSGSSGAPVAGAEVSLYLYDYRQQHRLLETRPSGADGRLTFDWKPGRENHFLVARHGGHISFERQPGLRQGGPVDEGPLRSALLATDRAIYRPEQTLHFKVIAYSGGRLEGRFRTDPKAPVTVRLRDANHEEVAVAQLTTNDFGTASGSFEIPTGRLLGGWWLETDRGAGTTVQVEEYKRPTFEVEVLEPTETLRLNRPATLGGEARYYFGLPVSEGDVAWRVVRRPRYPRWWWWTPPGVGQQTLAAGSTEVGTDGRFEITFTPEADERLADDERQRGISYSYELSVDVTDEGGETRSATRSFRLGFVTIEAHLEEKRSFYRHDQPITLALKRMDLDGVPRPGEGRWRLLALDGPAETPLPADLPRDPSARGGEKDDAYETPGDRLRPRWQVEVRPERILGQWDDGPERQHGIAQHGDDGQASLELGKLKPGVYRLTYSTTDPFGAEAEARWELIVARGGKTPLALPLVLMPEESTVAVGETARFLVHSGLAEQEMVFEIVRGNRRLERRVLSSSEGAQLVEVPVDESLRGGFGVRLSALRDHQAMTSSESIRVPWDDRRLQVEFSTFRDRLKPGAEETWTVTVRGADEAALAEGTAEVLALMYDRSLDLFTSYQIPDPTSPYPFFLGVSAASSNLGASGEVWRTNQGFGQLPGYPSLQGDSLRFYDGYAIGGPGSRGGVMMRKSMMMADGAVPESAMAVPAPPAPSPSAELEQRVVVAGEAVASIGEAEGDADTATTGDDGRGGDQPPTDADPLRSDFSETAFFFPHLRVGDDGSVSFDFQVPDSVTEWNVWAQAITRDLRGGNVHQTTRTVKDLLVRPYLPRFLREGDRAELRVVINNASEGSLSGHFDLALNDPESGASLLAEFGLDTATTQAIPFTVEPGMGTTLTFPVAAPRRVGPVTLEARAQAQAEEGTRLSDGERRALPLLPSRIRLAQSRFAALQDEASRTLRFDDLAAGDDPTLSSEQLVVTLEAQLFYSVLNALPYLVRYPYACTEQTLNRFLSTGIVSSLYDRYPSVATMAKSFSGRDTRLEAWGDDDPNRRMLLEESPWLRLSRGQDTAPGTELIDVLDPEIARRERAVALAELEKAQTSLGAFPWWPGGPPSPHMTLYLLMGFSRALEFDVEVPQPMVQRAWGYLHRHYVDQVARRMVEQDCCVELVTFLGYVLSSYPDPSWTGGVFSDDDRRVMLDHSFRHWRDHSPLIKGYLALTLERAGRSDDARLVWDSVMDSAKTDQDLGTYWAPEERSWLWYNDTVESQAFALRVLSELEPDDPRRTGLVHWLFLDKKLGHWKSTRATAEAIYALTHYLSQEDQLAQREAATIRLGELERDFVFEPGEYTGHKSQWRIDGEDVTPAMGTIEVSKETPGLMFASATWHFATDRLPEVGDGDFFHVERRYFRRRNTGEEWILESLADGTQLAIGDQLEVQLSVRAKHAAEYVHLRDPRGAGFEPEKLTSGYRWDVGLGFYEETRDSGANFFFDWLPVGEYTLKYRLRATTAGTFRVGPATLQSMYAPEFTAYSSGKELTIGGE